MKARFPYVTQSGKMLTSGLTSHVYTVIPRANTKKIMQRHKEMQYKQANTES